jgi:hypothetical protein
VNRSKLSGYNYFEVEIKNQNCISKDLLNELKKMINLQKGSFQILQFGFWNVCAENNFKINNLQWIDE